MDTLQSIHIYPVKSCAGIAVEQAQVQAQGLAFDRRWLLVDEQGCFLTQRDFPQMARIEVAMVGDMLQLRFDGLDTLEIPVVPQAGPRREVEIWGDRVQALDLSPLCGDWFAQALGKAARLVFMDQDCRRLIKAKYGVPEDVVSFADGLPLLIATRASLNDLQQRAGMAIDMSRFRPNVVVDGGLPFAEDNWQRIRIGNIEFEVTNPCARCVIPLIDQRTGEKHPLKEPIKTLNQFRRRGNEVLFGTNLVPRGSGSLRLGDAFEVLQTAHS